jgi:hypothetical protein
MQQKTDKEFKILCIDGGGIKGLYSATVLQHFEEKFNCRISDHFDMLCGTSTGGLIALGLSLKIPAAELVKFYVDKGPKIFPNRSSNWFLRVYGAIRQTLWKGKFNDTELKKALDEIFGDAKIGQSNNLLCIPSYTITEARPWIFKFDHKEGDLSRDNTTTYVEAALATTAAPTYFPVAELESASCKQFIDGGVWANNPTLVGYIEALTYFVGEGKEYDRLSILSLSSLSVTGGKRTGINRRRSFIKWRNELFETSMTGQSKFSEYFMSKIADLTHIKVKYVRIPSAVIASQQEGIIQLDVASKNALNLIQGKGNDQGDLFKKKSEIAEFFKEKKHFNVSQNG